MQPEERSIQIEAFANRDAFFAWAEEIARTHGFAHLTEDDVAMMIHQARQEDNEAGVEALAGGLAWGDKVTPAQTPAEASTPQDRGDVRYA